MSITMKVRNAVVALEDLDGEEFPCVVVEGETWNGFALPYFTRAVAVRLVNAFAREWGRNGDARIEWEGDDVVVYDLREAGEWEESERYAPETVGGELRYGIGARAWMWMEV